MKLWGQIKRRYNAKGLSPKLLRDLRIYGGAQGIWIDKTRTNAITEDNNGVTVSVLHTGSSYPDDLTVDKVIYHYPSTRRPPTRDISEINATKSSAKLGLPIFVITYPSPNSAKRDVFLGWVTTWDDDKNVFEIFLGDDHPTTIINQDDWVVLGDEITKPLLYPEGITRKISVNAYERNPKARQACIDFYGTTCSICNFNFGVIYGKIAEDYIHVHHIQQLSEIGGKYEINPIEDLIPVCPNCHAVIHMQKPAYTIDDVKAFLGKMT